jgi:23S rRNA (cytidine2498-2'-O)-methyltransferase
MPATAHASDSVASPFTAYLAPDGFLSQLQEELAGQEQETIGRLVLVPGPPRPVAWTANIWLAPERIPIASIGDVFGDPAPTAPLGSWTMIAPDMILASAACASPFPHGEARFVEDRQAPPSRAYLKLWEAFTLLGERPKPGETCIDLGASPGGWTWVLQGQGARVISVDKAPLDPKIAALPNIDYRNESAFAIDPKSASPVDWLFSDVVCYPARLLTLVEKWMAAGAAGRFVCTLKFQGETDFETMRRFAAIPGSRLMHLHANKHELTWVKF